MPELSPAGTVIALAGADRGPPPRTDSLPHTRAGAAATRIHGGADGVSAARGRASLDADVQPTKLTATAAATTTQVTMVQAADSQLEAADDIWSTCQAAYPSIVG